MEAESLQRQFFFAKLTNMCNFAKTKFNPQQLRPTRIRDICMKKQCVGVLLTLLFIAIGPNCFSQNGLITSGDYHCTAKLNGADCFIGNALVEVYSDVVIIKYYKSTEKELNGHNVTYNFDKVDNNGNRIYLANVESSKYDKLTYYSNGSILASTYSITYIPYVGRKDFSIADYRFTKGYIKASSSNASNNTYNNSYNNSNQTTYVTCPACGGSGRDQGRIQWYTNGGSRYCATCGTSGLAHDHIYGQCGRCGGTGRVQQ